jgi:stage II sporulation protein D
LALLLAACGGLHDAISLSGTTPPAIRVQLGDLRESAALTVADEWEATGSGTRSFSARGTNLATAVEASGSGIVFRGTATGATTLRVRPTGAFTLSVGSARHAYRGELIVRQVGARLQFANEIDLETYVAGVLVNEIGPAAAASTYRAQSVCSRTYGWMRRQSAPDAPTHVFDDERSQVYRGLTIPTGSAVTFSDLEKRTAETRGVVLTWHSEPFPTYYFSTCGGHTTDAATAALDPAGATDPLRGVPCKWCSSSKYFTWAEEVPLQKIVDGLRDRGVVAPIHSIAWSKVGPGDWVGEVTVVFGPGKLKKVVPGPDFRRAAGLRSLRIVSVAANAESLTIRGSGWGHGLGMCQVGCQEMGRAGYDETHILRYYYPGAEFTRLY